MKLGTILLECGSLDTASIEANYNFGSSFIDCQNLGLVTFVARFFHSITSIRIELSFHGNPASTMPAVIKFPGTECVDQELYGSLY